MIYSSQISDRKTVTHSFNYLFTFEEEMQTIVFKKNHENSHFLTSEFYPGCKNKIHFSYDQYCQIEIECWGQDGLCCCGSQHRESACNIRNFTFFCLLKVVRFFYQATRLEGPNHLSSIATKMWDWERVTSYIFTRPVDKFLHKALSAPSIGRCWKQLIFKAINSCLASCCRDRLDLFNLTNKKKFSFMHWNNS